MKTVTTSGKSVNGSHGWVPVTSVLVVAVAGSCGKFASWTHGWVIVASVLW